MCGIFGIYGSDDAVWLTYLGLFSLQHRGEESAGIASVKEGKIIHHKGMGLVQDVFSPEILNRLKSHCAIGHNRYSTTGASLPANCQPLVVEASFGMIAIGHNGNLVNAASLKAELSGQVFHTTTDTEVILNLIASSRDIYEGVRQALLKVKGSYSLVILTPQKLIAARDRHGFRPLCFGKKDASYIVASESCALDAIGARFVRDIKPGEILFIDHREVVSEQLLPPQPAYCMFEYVYFARPDSMVNGQSVYKVRKNLGINLAREHPTIADAVVPIPDSGNYAAIGFSESSKIPLEMGYIRSHYIGRTFIQPSQEKRNLGVELKLRAIKDAIEGKRVVVIDDSIVRGTTARLRSKILKSAGARELHLRISCPPLRFPCIYGIDFPTKEELIASSKSVEEIKRFISGEDLFGGIETLGYLSLDGLLKSIQLSPKHICTACWTGNYPVVPDRKVDKFIFEK